MSDDGTQRRRVHETMEFAAAVLDDEKVFSQMIGGELLKALRAGKNILVIAPPMKFDSFGLPQSRIEIPHAAMKDPRPAGCLCREWLGDAMKVENYCPVHGANAQSR